VKQIVYIESNLHKNLKYILKENKPKKILLITGKHSYKSCGAKEWIQPILKSYKFSRFSEFDINPQFHDLLKGLDIYKKTYPDFILAIGGGSVLDMAKLIRIFASQSIMPHKIIEGSGKINRRGIPLIAMPTTAGSGSEATHFAVIYYKGKKYSVANKFIRPEYVFINPQLMLNLPAYLTAVTGMDALSQAIESFWSVNATTESQQYSSEVIKTIMKNIVKVVNEPDYQSRLSMSKAAYLSGKAINISKTTAPHAISYTLTSKYGIPHGHAVALSLGEFFKFNSKTNKDDLNDPRGVSYVKQTMEKICLLLEVNNANEANLKIRNLMKSIGLEYKLSKLLSNADAERDEISKGVNIERLSNNPRKVTYTVIQNILNNIL
jgi:alcohol dehydrogenase class IV